MTPIGKDLYIYGGDLIDNTYNPHIYHFQFEHHNFDSPSTFPALKITRLEIFGHQPRARTAHCAVAFKNRYMLMFGGEGNQSETNSEALLLNDLWSFDTHHLRWTEIKVENGHTVRPRINFTANIYHNNLIIFGGLMDHLKISDDLYVLTLNDSLFHDDPVVSVCFICKFDFKTNLKVKQVNNALLEARVLAEHKFVTSFEHIYKVAATIVQPFDAIGLVIASLSTYPEDKSLQCKITLLSQEHPHNPPQTSLLFSICNIDLTQIEFSKYVLNYMFTSLPNSENKYLKEALRNDFRELYLQYLFYNIKNAAARLGNECLFCCCQDGIYSLYLFSHYGITSALVDGNMNELYSEAKTQVKILKQYLTGHKLTMNTFKNHRLTLHISSLRKTKQEDQYELYPSQSQQDILTTINPNYPNTTKEKSLHKYLEKYFIDKPTLTVELQHQPILFSYYDVQYIEFRISLIDKEIVWILIPAR